ncbi:hypothetical protein IAR55_005338 [Kwoniella newhampshirensis]|uniref:Uncharacterized protein n=1 Tax=Kwoniella newhampshirensis TaxID=1651941 RepID=A0AAW0YW39_9TREE
MSTTSMTRSRTNREAAVLGNSLYRSGFSPSQDGPDMTSLIYTGSSPTYTDPSPTSDRYIENRSHFSDWSSSSSPSSSRGESGGKARLNSLPYVNFSRPKPYDPIAIEREEEVETYSGGGSYCQPTGSYLTAPPSRDSFSDGMSRGRSQDTSSFRSSGTGTGWSERLGHQNPLGLHPVHLGGDESQSSETSGARGTSSVGGDGSITDDYESRTGVRDDYELLPVARRVERSMRYNVPQKRSFDIL